MPPRVQLIEVPGGPWPVERFFYADYYDGPVSGFVRCPGLGLALGLSIEFVCGPALPAYWELGYYDRPFLATPIAAGTCERLHPWADDRHPDSNWGANELGIWTRPLPPDLDALYKRFEPDEAVIQGELVIRFGDRFTTLQAWRATDGQTLTQNQIEAVWPGPPPEDFERREPSRG
jgi:hypothetical protein